MKTLFSGGSGGSPLVSVLISLHNYERHIIQAVDSVVAQTLREVELLICDDLSNDDGPRMAERRLRECADRFVRAEIVAHKVNRGLSATRNTALARAAAPFVFILDADNFLFPSCLERLTVVLGEAGDDVAFAWPQRLMFQDDNPQDCHLENLHDWDVPMLTIGNHIDAMALHRTDVLRRVGGYCEEPPFDRMGHEDHEIWLRYAREGLRGVRVHQPLAAYRVHDDSMVHAVTMRRAALRAIWRGLRERYPDYFAIPWEGTAP